MQRVGFRGDVNFWGFTRNDDQLIGIELLSRQQPLQTLGSFYRVERTRLRAAVDAILGNERAFILNASAA
ncbi:hypothetical protein FOBRF1_004245 [Fusarium oxysporum]